MFLGDDETQGIIMIARSAAPQRKEAADFLSIPRSRSRPSGSSPCVTRSSRTPHGPAGAIISGGAENPRPQDGSDA